MIQIKKIDDVYLQIHASQDVRNELNEYFSFRVKDFQFTPAYKAGWWDGYIRLYKYKSSTLYVGLLESLKEFLSKRNYEYNIEFDHNAKEFSLSEAEAFIKTLNIPSQFDIKHRDFQLKSFIDAVRYNRRIFILPTGSGKSLSIYLIMKWFEAQGKKSLLIVPRVSLVHQMISDFKEYGADVSTLHGIYSGQSKDVDENISCVVSVWNSIYKQPVDWFNQFDVVHGDEVHEYESKSLTGILESLKKCPHRFGYTGTLKESKAHRLALEGLFGPSKEYVTIKELQERGILAKTQIKVLILKYPDEDCKKSRKFEFHDEVDFTLQHQGRMRFLTNLINSLSGITLVLFTRKEDHGHHIKESIENTSKFKTFYIDGDINGTVREDYRQQIKELKDAVVMASFGTFAMGVNIPNIDNIIFASYYKSKVKVLQSLGRGLRVHEGKTHLTLFDIADDLRIGKHVNYSYQHLEERISIYDEKEQDIKIYRVNIKS